MKKALSIILVAAMLITTVVAASITVSAMDGDWSVYTLKSQYLDGYADYYHDVPGYDYIDEGLKMIPAPWEDSTPYATFQTTEMVNLKEEGVYLKVRVDQFTYTAGDKWFGFSLWDDQNVELGKQGGDYGFGVETVIRVKDGVNGYDESDKNTWAGAMNGLEWYKDLEENDRIRCSNTANDKLWVNEFDENRCPIITIKVYWDSAYEMYMININGVDAPSAYNQAATDLFHDEEKGYGDDMAYVGFSLQNNEKGGTIGCTILEFGTCTDDGKTINAAKPQGDDSEYPEIFSNYVAEMGDPANVPEGDPAIYLTAIRSFSDVKGKPSSPVGNILVTLDDDSLNVRGNIEGMASVKYIVDNEVSYDVEDFPIALAVTRNFCTCTYKDQDSDGILDEYCECHETVNMMTLAGDLIQEESRYSGMSYSFAYWEPYYVGDDFYHSFMFDCSSIDFENVRDDEGNLRINGLRLDFHGLKGADPLRNNFDICFVAFFRSYNEAQTYFEDYIGYMRAEVEPPEYPETDPETGYETDSDIPEDEVTYYDFTSYTDGGELIWKSSNKGIDNSIAVKEIAIDQNSRLSFDYMVSSEYNYDLFRVYRNGVIVLEKSGDNLTYSSYEMYVGSGDVVRFEYIKDVSYAEAQDCAYVKNIVITETDETEYPWWDETETEDPWWGESNTEDPWWGETETEDPWWGETETEDPWWGESNTEDPWWDETDPETEYPWWDETDPESDDPGFDWPVESDEEYTEEAETEKPATPSYKYTSFTSKDRLVMTEVLGTVLPFIRNNGYLLEKYTLTDGKGEGVFFGINDISYKEYTDYLDRLSNYKPDTKSVTADGEHYCVYTGRGIVIDIRYSEMEKSLDVKAYPETKNDPADIPEESEKATEAESDTVAESITENETVTEEEKDTETETEPENTTQAETDTASTEVDSNEVTTNEENGSGSKNEEGDPATGCGGTLSFGAVSVMIGCVIGLFAFKKKKNE